MENGIRTHIVDAVKRITESTWRGREHTAEEVVGDIKNYLDEEKEENITGEEWQAILEKFPVGELSSKILKVKSIYKKRYGENILVKQKHYNSEEKIEDVSDVEQDLLAVERKLIHRLRELRKNAVEKIITLYKKRFGNISYLPSDEDVKNFIREKRFDNKDNRRTVIIALGQILGLERTRKIFDEIDEKKPFESKMQLFERWLKKQKSVS